MINIKNLTKVYKSGHDEDINALDKINLKLPSKGFVCVLGRSGSGKTTLLNLIGGLDIPTVGNIIVDGIDITKSKRKAIEKYRNVSIGTIFQEFYLLDGYTVAENITFALELQGLEKEEIEKRLTDILKQVEMERFKNSQVSRLSGGQKQRVAIARTLIKNPKIILADEPTGNLDSESASLVVKILKEKSKNALVVLVTHNNTIANEFSDRIIELKDGLVISDKVLFQENLVLDSLLGHNPPKTNFKFSKLLKMTKHNILYKKVVLLFAVALYSISLGLVIYSSTINDYTKYDALTFSIEEKNQYIYPMQKYENKCVKNAFDKYICGLHHLEMTEADKQVLEENYSSYDSLFYSSFYAGLSLYDFNINDSSNFKYMDESYHQIFTDAVVVDDFSKFKSALRYGNYPTTDNEVIISDYSADLLLKYKIIDATTMKDIVGKSLLHKSGFIMSISGILKTDYDSLYNKVNFNDTNALELEQLTNDMYNYRLQYMKIYAMEVFVDNFNNIDFVTLKRNIDYGKNDLFTNIRAYDTGSLNIIAENSNVNGLWLSTSQLIYLTDDKDDFISSAEAEAFLNGNNSICLDMLGNNFNFSVDRVLISSMTCFYVSGIYFNNDDLYIDELLISQNYFDNLHFNSGDFNNIYVDLSNDSLKNKNFIKLVDITDKSKKDEWWVENRDYNEVHYTFNMPLVQYLNNSDYIMTGIKNIANSGMYIFILLTLIVVSLFLLYKVDKNKKSLGTLRALGVKNINIYQMLLLEVLIISLISWFLAIPIGHMFIRDANSKLVEEFIVNITFFKVGINNILLSLLLAIVISIITTIVPLIKVFKMKPINVIKD